MAVGSNNKETYLVSLVIAPIDCSRDMATRSIDYNITRGGLNNINRAIETYGELSTSILTRENGAISGMSIQPKGRAHIENGWGAKRFRYVLTTETERRDGSLLRTYVSGYTDTPGATFSRGKQVFNGGMNFVINNIVESVGSRQHNNEIVWNINAAYNVMQNRNGESEMVRDSEAEYMLRPYDMHNISMHAVQGHNGTNLAGMISDDANSVSHSNRNTNVHLVNTVNSLVRGHDSSELSHDVVTSTYTEAVGHVIESNVYSNPFIEMLIEIDNSKVRADGWLRTNFTHSDLVALNGGRDITSKVNGLSNDTGAILNNREVVGTSSTLPEVKIAYDLLNIISSELWKRYVTVFSFTVTNDIRDNNRMDTPCIASPHKFGSLMAGSDEVKLTRMLLGLIETSVFPQIVPRGSALTIFADIDLFANSYLEIRLDDRRGYTIELPTFADNTYNNLRSDIDGVNDMHSTYENITRSIV